MKLVLTLAILSLCAVWVSSHGADTELKTKSDSSSLTRDKREAAKPKTKVKKERKRQRNNGNNKKKTSKVKRRKNKTKPRKQGDKNGKRQNKRKIKKEKQLRRKPATKKKPSKPKDKKDKLTQKLLRAKSQKRKAKKPKKKSPSSIKGRQDDTCPTTDGVTDECLANAKTVLIFEGYYRNNFRNQYNRFVSHNKTTGSKNNKKLDFDTPAEQLKSSVGSSRDVSNISCVYGADNQSYYEQMFIETYDKLKNCSTFIDAHCYQHEVNTTTWETMERCNDIMESTKTETEKCRKLTTDGPAQCECWANLKTNHFDVVKKIRPKCNGMLELSKKMRTHKNICVDKFRECKKAQDFSVSLIYHCQHFDENDTWNPVINETAVAKEVAEGKNALDSRSFHQFISA